MRLRGNFDDVQDFHRRFGLTGPTAPELPAPGLKSQYALTYAMDCLFMAETKLRDYRTEDDVLAGRMQMMIEELREFLEACQARNLPDAADSLIDLAYFVFGTADLMGLPWQALWEEVHAANMRKERCATAAESKRLNKLDVKKPDGWQPPNVRAIIEAHQCEAIAAELRAGAMEKMEHDARRAEA